MKSIRPLLGTYVAMDISHTSEEASVFALNQAFNAIAKVQHLMSVFNEESDVHQISLYSHIRPVQIHSWTAEVLRLAQDFYTDSAGLFDCGIGNKLADWGKLPENKISYKASSIKNLTITNENIVTSTSPTRLDLGGIAKGYAVDRATEVAMGLGAISATVNAGGDLRVAGKREEKIYIKNPSNLNQLTFAGVLHDGACATSATYYSRQKKNHTDISAIFNPITQTPLITDQSFTIIAPRCAVADALTKVMALSDKDHALLFAKYHAQPLTTLTL